MRCSRCLLLQREEAHEGELFFTGEQFSLDGWLLVFRAGGHFCPGNFTLDDPGRIAVVSASGPELETVCMAGIGPAIA